MPAYLVQHRSGQRGDMLIEDPDLTVEYANGWAVFSDAAGPSLAIPADQVASVQRIDPDSDEQTDSDVTAQEG